MLWILGWYWMIKMIWNCCDLLVSVAAFWQDVSALGNDGGVSIWVGWGSSGNGDEKSESKEEFHLEWILVGLVYSVVTCWRASWIWCWLWIIGRFIYQKMFAIEIKFMSGEQQAAILKLTSLLCGHLAFYFFFFYIWTILDCLAIDLNSGMMRWAQL